MLDGVHPLVIVIVITIFVLFLTEVTSNTTATMILPILCAICSSRCTSNVINGTRYGANCAYMLPVGTPQMLLYLDQVS